MSKFKEWRDENIEKRRLYDRDYYAKNIEHLRLKQKGYRQKPHSKKLAQLRSRRYYGKKLGNGALELTGMCTGCGLDEITERHHLIPRWFSGDDDKNNLMEVCKRCHHKYELFMLLFLAGRYNGEA